jgi:hypothetical protein
MKGDDLYTLNIFSVSWFDGLTMTRVCHPEPVEG